MYMHAHIRTYVLGAGNTQLFMIIHEKISVARLSDGEVLGMLFDPDFDSGGESYIDEDPAIPLPQCDDLEDSHSQSPSPRTKDRSKRQIEESESEGELLSEDRRRGRGKVGRRERGNGVRGRGRGTAIEESQCLDKVK